MMLFKEKKRTIQGVDKESVSTEEMQEKEKKTKETRNQKTQVILT
jgi:hypothetical protein